MTAPPAPDPVAILLAEHEAAAAEFAAFERALAGAAASSSEAASRARDATRRLLAFLDRGLEVHIRKEEEPFFPLLKAALPPDDRLIDEMVAEHDHIRLKREDLRAVLDGVLAGHDHEDVRREREALRTAAEGGTPDLEAIGRPGRALLRTLRVHFQNEEEIVFPLAPELLTAEQLAAAGRAMEAIDREVTPAASPGQPVPRLAGAPALTVDLAAELQRLREGPAWAHGDRSAVTLVKEPDLRVVLAAMKAGARLAEHTAPASATVHVLSGRLRVTIVGVARELGPGSLMAIEQATPHAFEALEESTFLLTLAWPNSPTR